MKYYIQLPDNVRVSPRQYLAALRLAQANPQQRFRGSFRDPTGWMGTSRTGAQIVAQHFEMLHDRWASWSPLPGKGNRARKRAEAIAARKATCKWCGQLTGGPQFCDRDCARSYSL